MFRRINGYGKADIFVVVHVDDILVAVGNTDTLEGFAGELRGKFAIWDLRDTNVYMGRHITRSVNISTSRLWRNGIRLHRQV